MVIAPFCLKFRCFQARSLQTGAESDSEIDPGYLLVHLLGKSGCGIGTLATERRRLNRGGQIQGDNEAI